MFLFPLAEMNFTPIIEILRTDPFIDCFHLPVVDIDSTLDDQAPCLRRGSGQTGFTACSHDPQTLFQFRP